ncbi:transglycosylase SLT domain-containing protein [Cupriavidus sp. IDO]|uniref:transglycosylase SLT domain-containing protein n=1 Tax=Cupriavidus sp. IDO TaxID=1539142 RepID=UPI00057931EF|nr:transporter substrate-binding domain-containing protein [Cupriavidus sp. IDO]KWR88514.1 lytic transglycosylase [Cupriavidus sp. IDO]
MRVHWLPTSLAGFVLVALLGALGSWAPVAVAQQKPASASATASSAAPRPRAADETTRRQLKLVNKPSKGDFDAMLERRTIRVLVPYSRTLYFNDQGHERGLTAELVRDLERYLNRTYAKRLGNRPLTIYIIPTTRDRLLPDVEAGLGDIAAGNLTETEERRRLVDFAAPRHQKPVREVVVTGLRAPALKHLNDLAGKTVHVRKSSSYYESLIALNSSLRRTGKAPVNLVLLPDEVEDEDAMEMVNAGLLSIVVVDDWKAKMWAQILPHVRVRYDLVVRNEGYTGWAFRKNSPLLRQALDDFDVNYMKKLGIAEYRLKQYMRRINQITNNTKRAEYKRFEQTLRIFELYGKDYHFDPLMLAAQGFQESRLNQNARSHVGAIGIMQIMPATGKELNVGDIRVTTHNIHAGAKYMDLLMTRYFPGAHFSDADRPLFAFASYNAGPGNIAKMRTEAQERGLNPDKWFNNVEIVVAEEIGIETTTYVRNIFKYYTAYRLLQERHAAREQALKAFKAGR